METIYRLKCPLHPENSILFFFGIDFGEQENLLQNSLLPARLPLETCIRQQNDVIFLFLK